PTPDGARGEGGFGRPPGRRRRRHRARGARRGARAAARPVTRRPAAPLHQRGRHPPPGHRVPRGDLAGRRHPPALPAHGGDVAERQPAAVPSRARRRRGDRPRDEADPGRARAGLELPARGRGLRAPHARVPLTDDADTDAFQAPPEIETPAEYERVQPHYFGLSPAGLVIGIAAVAFGAGVAALVTGHLAVGILLLVAALLLAALYVEQARRSRSSSFDHTRALAGFTGASVRTWTRAGREVTRLRFEANRLARERLQLQYALGGAAFDGDEARVAELRERLQKCVEQIEECAAQARRAVDSARARTSRERLAVASTEIRKPS